MTCFFFSLATKFIWTVYFLVLYAFRIIFTCKPIWIFALYKITIFGQNLCWDYSFSIWCNVQSEFWIFILERLKYLLLYETGIENHKVWSSYMNILCLNYLKVNLCKKFYKELDESSFKIIKFYNNCFLIIDFVFICFSWNSVVCWLIWYIK
jgi:hypothetical protein